MKVTINVLELKIAVREYLEARGLKPSNIMLNYDNTREPYERFQGQADITTEKKASKK